MRVLMVTPRALYMLGKKPFLAGESLCIDSVQAGCAAHWGDGMQKAEAGAS